MIDLSVDPRFIEDLKDDFVINEDLTLYEFIGKDPVKAFYLGLNINDWFEYIDRKQRYLYSKQARHNKDDLEKYQKQISFWSNKFPSDNEEVNMTELAEFIYNNMFWEEKTEDLDKVKLMFFFGHTIAAQKEKSNSNE